MDAFKVQINKLIVNNKHIIFLLIIGVLFSFLLWHQEFYLSHDGEAHTARFAAYFKSFMDGQFPPRWAADLNAGYGTPIFIFFYPLPGYLASFLHLIGFSFESVFKLLVFSSFLISPVCLYIWLKRQAKKEIALAAAVIYMVLPYRFLDMYVRGDVAELISFIFIPLIFLFIDNVLRKKNILWVIAGGICYGILILAHNGIALIFSPVYLIYILYFSKKSKDFIYALSILLLGLLISAFFWLPSIVESRYVMSNAFVAKIYMENFISVSNLFYSNWGFGPNVSLKGGLSPQVGILYMLIPLIILLFFNKFKKIKKVTFWLMIFFVSLFMTTKFSKIIWDYVPFLNLLGFPWRFTALSGFASCILSFYFLTYLNNKKITVFLVLLFIIFSLPFIKVNKYISSKNDRFYLSYLGTTDYNLRTNTIWTAGEFFKPPKRDIEIIGGQGTISNFYKNSTIHKFNVNAKTQLSILDNTVYFPGWSVEIDGNRVPIEFQDMNHRGLITFYVKQGSRNVKVFFSRTPIRVLSDIISIIGFMVIILFLIKDKLIFSLNKKKI